MQFKVPTPAHVYYISEHAHSLLYESWQWPVITIIMGPRGRWRRGVVYIVTTTDRREGYGDGTESRALSGTCTM